MNLSDILTREPVDGAARRVTSQLGVSEAEAPLTKPELVALQTRLLRRQRLLKHVLGIKTNSQMVNTKWKLNKGLRQYRGAAEPRALAELQLVGRQIRSIDTELQALRATRREAFRLQNGRPPALHEIV